MRVNNFVNICDVSKEIFAGGDAPKGNMSIEKTLKYSIPIFSNGEANDGLYGYTDFYRVSEPSITISARGTIGYAAIRTEPFVPIVRLIVITPKIEIVDIKYLYYAIKNYDFSKSGTSIPQLTVPMLKHYSFPLPPLPEQRRIAAVLDKVSELIALRKKQLALLDEMVKARFVEMFGDPVRNEKSYPIKHLSDVAEYWNGLTYKPEDISEKGIIVLRSSNIQNFKLDYSDIVRVSCKISQKKYVQANDILMCSRNGSAKLVGKVALIDNINEPMSFGAFMMIIRSNLYSYLHTYFQLPAFRLQITTGATTTINQITTNMLNKIVLPIPNEESISQFADFVQQVEKSKATVQQALEKLELLKSALMQAYFG